MQAGVWFWIIFVISILFVGWAYYPYTFHSGAGLIPMILIGLLGYRVFGKPVQ
jgi:hypothetical protein